MIFLLLGHVLLLLIVLLLLLLILLLLILLLLVLLLLSARPALSAHLLVVGLVLGEDLLPHFLLPLVDIRVKLVPVFSN